MSFISKLFHRNRVARSAVYRFEELKGSARGKDGFIVGNGPSLRMSDLDLLSDRITFASNKIFLAFPRVRWRPTFYAATDVVCIPEAQNQMLESSGTDCFFPTYAPRHRTLAAWYFDLLPSNPSAPEFRTDLSKGVGGGATVTFFHMQLAYYLGISKLYLLGCDCNYQSDTGKPDPEGYVTHTTQDNYFVKDYHEEGERIAKVDLDGQLQCFMASKAAWENDGRTIFNATRGGKLDIFDRVSLDEVLGAQQ